MQRASWHREDTRQDRKGRRWARGFERECAGVRPNYKGIQAVMVKQMLKSYFGPKGQLSCLDICSIWLLRSYIHIYTGTSTFIYMYINSLYIYC